MCKLLLGGVLLSALYVMCVACCLPAAALCVLVVVGLGWAGSGWPCACCSGLSLHPAPLLLAQPAVLSQERAETPRRNACEHATESITHAHKYMQSMNIHS